MEIITKSVIGYEGLYLIDNIGNVVSLPKKNGSRFVNKYNILKAKVNKLGYKEVALSKNGKTKIMLLHRLLAIHFIPNPNNFPQVNHINGIKSDNRLENLEWCTVSYNTKHAYENNLGGFRTYANAGIKKMNQYAQYISVVLIDSNGKELRFSSSFEAANYIGTKSDEITRAIRKKQRVKGYYAFGKKLENCANGET